jgi:hypothetical protein
VEFSIKIYRTGELDVEPVDLIISQYAGFVGQATKKYLNTGGILLCNDNPYSEALFKTMKYRSKYPTKRFSSLKEAREWVKKFVHWYNNFRIHGSLDYLTPEEFFFIVVSKFSFIILSYPQL